jgi:hypothetical protein
VGFPVSAVCFNNNDQLFASASVDGSITVFGLYDPKTVVSFAEPFVISQQN